jgi:acetyltransferase
MQHAVSIPRHALRLSDGRGVAIRSIRPSDREPLKAFFEALSPAARRLRFHLSLQELPASLLHAFTSIDHRSHVAFVAEPLGAIAAPAPLVAEARYVRDADGDAAELALAVADGWRRVGLGTFLARRLMRRARLAGVRQLFGDALPDNHESLGFLRSLGARTVAADSVETVRLSVDLWQHARPSERFATRA